MAAKNLTREQAFAEMAKGRRCRTPGGSLVLRLDEHGDVHGDNGFGYARSDFGGDSFATGWRLLKDLPPRSTLVRELAEVRSKLADAEASLDGWRAAEKEGHAALVSLRADLAHRTASLTETLADLATTKVDLAEVAAESDRLRHEVAQTKSALAEALARPMPRFKVGDAVMVGRTRGEVLSFMYAVQKEHGSRDIYTEESLRPAPTAKPEPAWVACGAAVAREKHAEGCRVRFGKAESWLRDGNWEGPDAVGGERLTALAMRSLATGKEATGWQWQEVGQ